MFRAFGSVDRGGLKSTPIWRYQRIVPVQASAPVLSFDNGDTAIAAGGFGMGKVVVCAIHATDPQDVDSPNAITLWPSFPPLIRGIVQYCASGREPAARTVGQSLSGYCPAAVSVVRLLDPFGSSTEIWTEHDGWSSSWKVPSTDNVGIYRLQTRDGAELSRIAVNVHSHESDLEQQELAPLVAHLGVNHGPGGAASQDGAHRSWSRWLLGALALLMVAEPLHAIAASRSS
jgi:hypothetical protein